MTTTVTYTFANSTVADATQVNQNFTDVLTGLNAVDKLTVQGDLLTRSSSAYSRLALGTAGKRLRSDGTDVGWSFGPQTIAKSADYTVTDTDGVEHILMTTSSTNRTITLPTAADNTYRTLTITKVDSGTGTVIIDGEGAETVNGAATLTLAAQYMAAVLVCNGTSWFANLLPPKTYVASIRRSGNADFTAANGPSKTRCNWDSENCDVGGWYDSSTNYRFTAPVLGVYKFALNFSISGLLSTDSFNSYLYLNSTAGATITDGTELDRKVHTGSANSLMTHELIVSLSAGDTVVHCVAVERSGGVDHTVSIVGGTSRSSLSGVFLGYA